MYTLLIALAVGLVLGALLTWATSLAWGIPAGILAMFLTTFLFGRVFMKRLTGVFQTVQEQIQAGQKEANRIIQEAQSKPGKSQKVVEKQVTKAMEKAVNQAIDELDAAEPLFKWTLLADRQVAAMKMQLLYQVKRFDEAYACKDKVLFLLLESMGAAIKMALEYRYDDPQLQKTYRRAKKKYKREQAILIYAPYSWILLKRGQQEAAREVLFEGKEKTGSELLAKNEQHLANDKPRLFSNAGLGEQWFALHLEQPPKQKPSKGQMRNHPLVGRGKRRGP